jgi:hypothetical protein
MFSRRYCDDEVDQEECLEIYNHVAIPPTTYYSTCSTHSLRVMMLPFGGKLCHSCRAESLIWSAPQPQACCVTKTQRIAQ